MLNNSEAMLVPRIELLKKEGYKMNTCFLLTHVPDPKTNKRIRVFKELGNVTVVCVRRKSQDIWEPGFDSVKHYIYDIDLPTARHIVKRYIVSSRYQKKAKRKLEEIKPDVIYADGLDSLLIASRYKKYNKVKVFYDVADLRETYIERPKSVIKRIVNNAIKRIEKKSFKNVDFLVVTSKKFYSVYYCKLIEKSKVIYIPNAPDWQIFEKYMKKRDGEFTVGFIGGIRYLEQMKMLVDAAEECGCRVIFSGSGGTSGDYEEISAYCKNRSHVKFTGKYDYNKEIAGLYSQVDCVYAVYDADNPNVRIALPNKLYEAIYCRLPIIVAKGTYLSELVEKWGVGISVNHKSKKELILALRELMTNIEKRETFENNCVRLMKKSKADSYNRKLTETL